MAYKHVYGKGTIYDIKYSPDGAKMAVATGIGIWIYDTETADELNLLTGHAKAVSRHRCSVQMAQPLLVAVFTMQPSVCGAWKVAERFTHSQRIRKRVKTVAFSPDGATPC